MDEITKRYENTPFSVSPKGPVVTVARTDQVQLRGWSNRFESSPSDPQATDASSAEFVVELHPTKGSRLSAKPEFVVADGAVVTANGFAEVVAANASEDKSKPRRFVARARESVQLRPGETSIPIEFRVSITNPAGTEQSHEGSMAIVLRTEATQTGHTDQTTGVALVGGMLELRLAHLCEQERCVEHLHASLAEIPGLAAVRPFPGQNDPRAAVYLRARQAVDVWSLCQSLRDNSIEVVGIQPHELAACRLHVELPRWRPADESGAIEQCLVCREATASALQELPWIEDVVAAGGGIGFRLSAQDVDLFDIINSIRGIGTVPVAVWLVPDGAAMPKAVAPQVTRSTGPRHGGSNAHPVVELEFAHTCELGTDVLTVLAEKEWVTRTHLQPADATKIARASLGDRKFANVSLLLDELQTLGTLPSQIRLSEFGDLRIQLEFANICGAIEYSKPPKKKAEKKDDKKEGGADTSEAKPEAPEKPFVPQPLKPAETSNGRQAIEAAVDRVSWVKQAVYHGYHTKPEFNGPKKLTLSLSSSGPDTVQLDELIQELRVAGFPPKSVLVSRRFPGIPFGKELPSDLLVTDRGGKRHPLGSLQKSGRPFAVAFVSLKCARYKKYKPGPKLYEHLAHTVDTYRDRVDFVAVSANPDDKFSDIARFWDQAELTFPLLHDADGTARGVFNSQATPPPHLFVFDGQRRLRYAGDPHDSWEKPEKREDDFLARALDLVLAGDYQPNGAVFYNAAVCNCSDPNCKCPKCGCGPTCRCTIKH